MTEIIGNRIAYDDDLPTIRLIIVAGAMNKKLSLEAKGLVACFCATDKSGAEGWAEVRALNPRYPIETLLSLVEEIRAKTSMRVPGVPSEEVPA